MEYLDKPWLRIHPGDLEQPLDVLPIAFGYAYALDDIAIRQWQFSVSDLIAVMAALLRQHSDALFSLFEPRPTSRSTPASHQPRRLESARAYLGSFTSDGLASTALEFHRDPSSTSIEQLHHATNWMTGAADRLRMRLAWPISILGPTLLIRSRRAVLPAPSAHLLSGLSEMLSGLCHSLDATTDRQVPAQQLREAGERWHQFAALRLRTHSPGDLRRSARPRARAGKPPGWRSIAISPPDHPTRRPRHLVPANGSGGPQGLWASANGLCALFLLHDPLAELGLPVNDAETV